MIPLEVTQPNKALCYVYDWLEERKEGNPMAQAIYTMLV